MGEIPDETVMLNVKNGNLSMMSVLFERYNVRIFNFFLKMGLRRDTSQDLTQNLFYRMMKYRNSYKAGNNVKTWIYQIARNLYTDYFNQQKKAGEVFMQTESYSTDIIDEPESFPEEDYERLDKALADLNDSQREIIVLSRYQGLKYTEISEIVSQSVPAIKVAVYRAIRQLRVIYLKQI
jgi:RNA polymerase sigma-70 factor (ECF subfamily)